MVNRMLRDADEFIKVLAKEDALAQPIGQLKKQLKHYSKNELVRISAAMLIAKNILEEKLKAKDEKPTDSTSSPVASSDPETATPGDGAPQQS